MQFFVMSGCRWGSILVTRGSIKNKIRVFLLVTFSGVGSGRVLECFSDVFLLFVEPSWYPFGSLLVAFWEPLGAGVLELLGS